MRLQAKQCKIRGLESEAIELRNEVATVKAMTRDELNVNNVNECKQ